MIEMHIPENVKPWESPGRAGGLPNCNYSYCFRRSFSFSRFDTRCSGRAIFWSLRLKNTGFRVKPGMTNKGKEQPLSVTHSTAAQGKLLGKHNSVRVDSDRGGILVVLHINSATFKILSIP